MTPREMFIEGILVFNYPGNVHKRVGRIERLADATKTEVYYGMNNRNIGIRREDDGCYEVVGLRNAERLLRQLKREATDD